MISQVPVFTSTLDEETQSKSSLIQEVYGFLVDMASRPNFIMSLFGNVVSRSFYQLFQAYRLCNLYQYYAFLFFVYL